MKIAKTMLFILGIIFGIFIFLYGGYDDSPGAQLLGVIIVGSNIVSLIKHRKKTSI